MPNKKQFFASKHQISIITINNLGESRRYRYQDLCENTQYAYETRAYISMKIYYTYYH